MKDRLSQIQRNSIRDLLLYRLGDAGKTIDELGIDRSPGDDRQIQYRDSPVWHSKSDLESWIAGELRLSPSLWGPRRKSNHLKTSAYRELDKLVKKGKVAQWRKRIPLFRLADGSIRVKKPVMSTAIRQADAIKPGRKFDMKGVFLSIISKGAKDNTYKFALGKTLLDYCSKHEPTEQIQEISYDYLAEEFLKHYWYQKYKFKMKQDFHITRKPKVISILDDVFGEKPLSKFDNAPARKFEDLRSKDVEKAKNDVRKYIFGTARQKKGMVVPRFQNIRGSMDSDTRVFYDYDDDEGIIYFKPEAHRFFRENYGLLTRALLAEWIKYLERANHGLPLLASKIENEEAARGPLGNFKKQFFEYEKHCFYCNETIKLDCVHVDHFIPWSYIFDDNAWNLVLACPTCNLRKSDSLPQPSLICELIDRDQMYLEKNLKMMVRSLHKLSFKGGSWKDEIRNHYDICESYGFGEWRCQ